MEMSGMAAEDSLRTDSIPVSTSSRSLIKINSISIDLLNADDEDDAQKCEHFSIRGYVSQIRKKNKKIGWPFPIDENDNKSESATSFLPPIDVHRFKWWRCKNCLQDIVAGCAMIDNEIVPCPRRCGLKSNASCAHVSSLDDVALPLNSQQPPKPFLIEGRMFDANTFTSTATNNEDLPLPLSKGRKYEVEQNTLIGHGLTDMKQKNARSTCIAAKVNPFTQKKHMNDGSVTPKSKCNGSVGVLEASTAGGEELNNASSDSDEMMSHGAPRRKFRKVRLLAELLGENRVAKTDCIRTSGSCSNAVSDVSLRQGTFSILQGPVAVQGGNVKWGFMGEKRKRKLPRDEEWRPPMSSLNNVDVTNMATEDAETESDEDTVVRGNPQIGSNCSFTKHRVQKDTTLANKKKARVIDLNKSHYESGDVSETDGHGTTDVLLSSVPNTFTAKGTYPIPSHDQRMKSKSNLYESKTSQVDDRMTYVVPLHDAKFVAVPTAGNDMEVTQTENVTGPIQSSQRASTRKRPDLSLNNYLTATRYDKTYSPQAGGLPSSLSWHEGTNQDMNKGIETNFIGDSRSLLKFPLNGVHGNGVDVEPSRKGVIYKMPSLSDKHKHSSHVEDGVGSLVQQMPFLNPNSNEKTIEAKEHSPVTKRHTIRRDDKVSELGTSDDIPMEIVELMAKNQYERCLHNAEREKQHPETMSNRSAQILDFTGGYGKKDFISLQDEIARKQKPQAKSGRDGIRITGGYMGTTKQKFPENTSGYVSPQNFLWIGDQARLSSLIACNTCQTQPQQSKEAASLWPSTVPNHTPFGFSLSRKCEAQSTNEEMFSHRVNSMHKRNTNGDPAVKFKNANVANHGQHQKNSIGSDTLVRTRPDYLFGCKHSTVPPKKTTGSLDLYSNETIPAMHLLSLMDAGVRSGASSGMEETQTMLKKKPLLPSDHSREFPAQFSHECFRGIQIGGASTSSFQENRSFQRMSNYGGQVSPKCPLKEKNKGHEISSQSEFQKLNNFFQGRSRAAVSHCNSEQMLLGYLHPQSSAFQSHLIGEQKLDGNVSTRNVWPLRSNLETEVCSVNRNPADFSLPGERNGYMIRGEDLKFRKRIHTGGGSVHKKHQKNMKLAAAKERVRQRNP